MKTSISVMSENYILSKEKYEQLVAFDDTSIGI